MQPAAIQPAAMQPAARRADALTACDTLVPVCHRSACRLSANVADAIIQRLLHILRHPLEQSVKQVVSDRRPGPTNELTGARRMHAWLARCC
jgi:hypothetical protein